MKTLSDYNFHISNGDLIALVKARCCPEPQGLFLIGAF